MFAPISFIVLLAPVLVLSQVTYDPTNYGHHPMIQAALDAQTYQDCIGVNPDPDSYWMKKFLNIAKDRLPQQAVTWDDLLPNLMRLVEYDEKGYLRAVAKGEMSAYSLEFPDKNLQPLIIPAYIPAKYPPEELPTIVLEQIYNNEPIFKNIISPPEETGRKRRSLDGMEEEEEENTFAKGGPGQPRAFRHDRSSYSDDIPAIDGHSMDHEVDELEKGENGEIHSRKRRSVPDGMAVFPAKNTLFAVKTLCVSANATGHIILPSD